MGTVDVVSAQQCVMSSPRLAAYSYMVVDNQCAGIPAQDKPVYQEEAKHCVRKAVVPSKVLSMLQERQHSVKRSQAPMRHLDMERGQKICISMKQVHMCPDTRSPSEIVPMQMPFFCVARDQEGYTLQQLAQSGEKINEATRFPISFSSMVYVPSRFRLVLHTFIFPPQMKTESMFGNPFPVTRLYDNLKLSQEKLIIAHWNSAISDKGMIDLSAAISDLCLSNITNITIICSLYLC